MSTPTNSKRRGQSAAFKAKVGMDALIVIKTLGQIARDYQIHPVQVTQWKGVIRDRLPELFASPAGADPDTQRLVAQLHERIKELTVELEWLKKSSGLFSDRLRADAVRG